MSNFNHYHDMDHDLKDSSTVHDMKYERNAENIGCNSSEEIPLYHNGKKVLPAETETSESDVVPYRVACALGALVTGVPGLLLFICDPSCSGTLSFLILPLLVVCMVSLKELICGRSK